MPRPVVLQLYGPLASWGDVAVGEVRPSWPHPTRSALLGLVGACLGLRRGDETGLRELAADFGLGLEVWSVGTSLTDYHTVQVPPGEGVRVTRRLEVAGPRDELSTVLSARDYRCDTFCRVALWPRQPGGRPPEDVVAALERPVFAPYLGRKSCPLALPMHPQVVEATTLVAAFDHAVPPEPPPVPRANVLLCWEDGIPAGVDAQTRQRRYDDPLSHARRQFAARWEKQAVLRRPDAPEA